MKNLITVLLILLLISGCSFSPRTLEYGVFYVETQGQFIEPIEADAPVIYRWTENKMSFQGDFEKLRNVLDIEIASSSEFSEVEVLVLNSLAKKGWKLMDFEISTVNTNEQDIRTAYRYLFIRR